MIRPFLLAALLTSSIATAFGNEPADVFFVDVGADYAMPFSKFASGEDAPWLLDVYSGVPAITANVGLHLRDGWYASLYGHYGFPDLQGPCNPTDCDAHQLRVGAQARYHFATPRGSLFWRPWVAFGGGFESTGFGFQATELVRKYFTFYGPELYLTAGADRRFWKYASIGPWVGLTAGTYLTLADRLSRAAIDPIGVHYWGGLGLRMTFYPVAGVDRN